MNKQFFLTKLTLWEDRPYNYADSVTVKISLPELNGRFSSSLNQQNSFELFKSHHCGILG